LPDSGIPAQLKIELAEALTRLHERLAQDDFYEHAADFNTLLTSLQSCVRKTTMQMEAVQQQRLQEAEQDLKRVPEWAELTQEEQSSVLGGLEELTLSVNPDLQGLKQLINQELVIHDRVSELKDRMARQGQERRRQRLEAEKAKAKQAGKTKLSRCVAIPMSITNTSQLDALIQELQALRHELALYSEIEVNISIQD
jgi:vacuolar-type H+-ATPase subunit I/STV1